MSHRNQKAEQARTTQHSLWRVRLQELMNEHSCPAPAALRHLHGEISLDSVPPTHRAAYRIAWTDFLIKVKAATAPQSPASPPHDTKRS
jgi:hypothetical protein